MAGGRGSRMGGDLPKVLHEVAGRPMLAWVLRACRDAGVTDAVVVVGYQEAKVRDAARSLDLEGLRVHFAVQAQQLGTGHAVMMAAETLLPHRDADTLVLCGDGPLITGETLHRILSAHRDHGAPCTLATAVLEDPTGYGRVVRGDDGGFVEIVEEKDATEAQRRIREVNPSYYAFRVAALLSALDRLGNDNAQGEYYLTDVPGLMAQDRSDAVRLVADVPAEQILGVNTPDDLAHVERLLQIRSAANGEPASSTRDAT